MSAEQRQDADYERPWPGFCQACGAPLDPPDLTWCPTCFASDEDE